VEIDEESESNIEGIRTNLIRKPNPLVLGAHQRALRPYDDLAGEMLQGEADQRRSKTSEARDAEKAVQEPGAQHQLQRRV
jgi:hypothetical protein